MVYEKGLKGNHHGILEISIMIVVLNLLVEDVTGIDYSSYVLHIYIFVMMTFTNHTFPEIEVFDAFFCN